MKRLIMICILAIGLAYTESAESIDAKFIGKASVITATDLAARIEQVSILDARGWDAFVAGHIPGSYPVDWREWTQEYPGFTNYLFGSPRLWGKVPAPSRELQERLRLLGLANDKQIVVVGDPNGMGEEGRIAWNLLYWGARDVALLDGGYEAWAAGPGRGIESGEAYKTTVKGNFTIEIQRERIAQIKEVLSALDTKDRVILDVRSQEEFKGEATQWGQERGGHIPGAVLAPFDFLYEESGAYVKRKTLEKMIPQGGDKSPIAYCTGGVRAALLAVLYEARTGKIAANYAGSIWEWSANAELPMATGDGTRRLVQSPHKTVHW